jgi:hypothetical protein
MPESGWPLRAGHLWRPRSTSTHILKPAVPFVNPEKDTRLFQSALVFSPSANTTNILPSALMVIFLALIFGRLAESPTITQISFNLRVGVLEFQNNVDILQAHEV